MKAGRRLLALALCENPPDFKKLKTSPEAVSTWGWELPHLCGGPPCVQGRCLCPVLQEADPGPWPLSQCGLLGGSLCPGGGPDSAPEPSPGSGTSGDPALPASVTGRAGERLGSGDPWRGVTYKW